jgi:hypothetical protein
VNGCAIGQKTLNREWRIRTAASLACKLGGIGTADPPTRGDLAVLLPLAPLPDPLGGRTPLGRVNTPVGSAVVEVTGSASAGLKFSSSSAPGVASELESAGSDDVSVVVLDEGFDSGSDSLIAEGQCQVTFNLRHIPVKSVSSDEFSL